MARRVGHSHVVEVLEAAVASRGRAVRQLGREGCTLQVRNLVQI